MTERMLFVSTTGGWVSFDREVMVDIGNVSGELIVKRNEAIVGYFKPAAWGGYVWAEIDESGAMPKGVAKGGPRPIS